MGSRGNPEGQLVCPVGPSGGPSGPSELVAGPPGDEAASAVAG